VHTKIWGTKRGHVQYDFDAKLSKRETTPPGTKYNLLRRIRHHTLKRRTKHNNCLLEEKEIHGITCLVLTFWTAYNGALTKSRVSRVLLEVENVLDTWNIFLIWHCESFYTTLVLFAPTPRRGLHKATTAVRISGSKLDPVLRSDNSNQTEWLFESVPVEMIYSTMSLMSTKGFGSLNLPWPGDGPSFLQHLHNRIIMGTM
jgi:hypothetical protein